jgi:hypothetical protein
VDGCRIGYKRGVRFILGYVRDRMGYVPWGGNRAVMGNIPYL